MGDFRDSHKFPLSSFSREKIEFILEWAHQEFIRRVSIRRFLWMKRALLSNTDIWHLCFVLQNVFSSSEFKKDFPSVIFTRNDALELQKSPHKRKGENIRIIKYRSSELRWILMCAWNKRSETQKDVESEIWDLRTAKDVERASTGENYIHKSSKNRRKSKSEKSFSRWLFSLPCRWLLAGTCVEPPSCSGESAHNNTLT